MNLRKLSAQSAAVLLFVIASQSFAAPAPIEDFFRNPEFAQVELSPDGTHIAAMAPVNDRQNIIVMNLETREIRPVTGITDQDVSGLMWATNDRILFFMDKDGNESLGIFAVNKDGSKPETLVAPAEAQVNSGRFVVRAAFPFDVMESDPDHILVLYNKRDVRYQDLYRLNIHNGRMRVVKRAEGKQTGYVVDQDDELRVMTHLDGLDAEIKYLNPETDDWETLQEMRFDDAQWNPLAIGYDKRTLYVSSTLSPDGTKRDKAAVYEYDLVERKLGDLIYEHPDADVAGIALSKVTKKPVAVPHYYLKPGVHYVDEKWEARQAQLDSTFKDSHNSLVSVDDKETKAVVLRWDSQLPGMYYLWDFEKNQIEVLTPDTTRPWLKSEPMGEMKPVVIKARDGLALPSYLTLPPGAEAKKLPMVIMPHGGPWARDTWGWRPDVQFLASRGYAVLQTNFRGSTGFGFKHFKAGYREWGKSMQHDVTDAVKWAIDEGIADANRVCIFGASYGGYATMAGLTFTPDLYQCGINYVGVTDIPLLFSSAPAAWESGMESMKVMVGDPKTDREMLEDRSPSNHIDKIQAPLLMAYGRRDPRVVLKHAEIVEKELRKHDKEYELIVEDKEGHGFRKFENQVEFYAKVEDFLAKHIGGKTTAGGRLTTSRR